MSTDEREATERATRIASEIVAKRVRQQAHHGFWVEHDDRYRQGELAQAAGTYALVAAHPGRRVELRKRHWPWADCSATIWVRRGRQSG